MARIDMDKCCINPLYAKLASKSFDLGAPLAARVSVDSCVGLA